MAVLVLSPLALTGSGLVPVARASVKSSSPASANASGASGNPSSANSLEAAASKAGDTGRKVAMSLLGLALAIAAVVLVFKRDFKEAAGVLAVGLIAVLLATPTGINVLRDTVGSLFGSQ